MEGTIGEIRLFAGTFAPVNWAMCDGTLYSISEYQATYTILGTTYGGDGQTTFGVPDLRGRVPVHTGQGPGLPNIFMGQTGGEESHTLIASEIPSHVHGVTMDNTQSSKKLNVNSGVDDTATPVAGVSIASRQNSGGTLNTYKAATTPDVALNAGTLAPVNVPNTVVGGSQPHENMQPFMALNYVVCMIGVYPSRS